ncbi:alpha/beta hydrolase [Alteraurantiacibacter aestuarii]|uniref:Alpha/beta fold hydrolase n=1 Tax=Alteraurantiacibacter aestuarii TaxID=650004 RepID=A0A844ZQ40_9SPHN|nr:alpha/beta hydrolase [Alteraurantiacibacter aestuarii]MXO88907.1 alpha/beta fold hydrolase [Alteraurantiacibacter aestuarii]
MWRAPDGHEIRWIDFPPPDDHVPVRGSILFMPGRGDFYEKYLETFENLRLLGWRVSAADWRGQAGSGRLGADAVTGHIDDFGIWTADLAAFWSDWAKGREGALVLAGHSMGGHLVLRTLAEKTLQPHCDGLVMIAPMLGVQPQFLPVWLQRGVARVQMWLGDSRRPAWKWSEKPGEVPRFRQRLLTHDDARYADELWWRDHRPQLVMGPGSWSWVASALRSISLLNRPGMLEAVATPVLILAVKGDKLVSPRAIRRAARRLPHARLVEFGPEAAHEILREADPVRNRALAQLDDFLNRLAPV